KYQPAGEVWSIDANTGEVLWKQSLNRVVLGAVAVTGDQLFCASRGGTAYSLRPSDGEILRTFDVHEPVIASPAVNSSHIFISTSSGRLFCLDRDSLQPVWSMQFGEGGMAFSSPTVARGHVYVGSEKGGLFSLGRVAENVVGPVWSGYLGDTGHTAVWGNPSLPERGSKLSEYPDREALQAAQDAGDPLLITAPPALYDEMLYIPVSGGDEGFRLTALPEGEKREFARPAWSHSVGSTITMSAAVSPENVFLVDGAKGDDERQLHCLGRTSGTLRWQQPVASEASGAFVLAHDRLYINDVAGQLSCLGLDDGELLWKQEMGGDPFTPVQYGAMTFATVRDSSHLIALDRETGVVLWKTALENGIVGSPVIFEETIIAPTAQGIEARNMVDGSSIWEQVTAKPASALVITLSALAFTASDGAVIAMNPETGDILDRTEGASPPWPPLVLDNTLLYVADGQIMSKTIGGEESAQRWMTTSWLGELTTPLLVKDAWLYFGTSERGLVRAGKWR
ncbi:MAG: PQQ-binding-like beta-propeller repeat protein, partial [Candidatus Sumerlaeota bacterium]